ncbi:UNVERIFIED_CONTAM: hypothetical protein NCL1_03594 [Trichonephila clavipes]
MTASRWRRRPAACTLRASAECSERGTDRVNAVVDEKRQPAAVKAAKPAAKTTVKPSKPAAAKADPGRRYRGVSEAARQAERRQRFIEAGLTVFGSRGYHSSTVRSICSEAGLTERYFYESFANSEDLLCVVYEHVNQRIRERILATLLDLPQDPAQIARAVLTAFLECMRDDPRMARMLFVEVLGVSDRVDALYRESAQLAALGGGLAVERVQEHAAAGEDAVHVGDHGRDPAHVEVLAAHTGLAGQQLVDVTLHRRFPEALVGHVDGELLGLGRDRHAFLGQDELARGRGFAGGAAVQGEGVHAVAQGQDELGRRAVDGIAGGDLGRARLQERGDFGGIAAGRRFQHREDCAHRHVDVDVRGAVERVEQQQVAAARRAVGDRERVVHLLRGHAGEVAAAAVHVEQDVVGDHVQLLLVLALHVGAAGGAEHAGQRALADGGADAAAGIGGDFQGLDQVGGQAAVGALRVAQPGGKGDAGHRGLLGVSWGGESVVAVSAGSIASTGTGQAASAGAVRMACRCRLRDGPNVTSPDETGWTLPRSGRQNAVSRADRQPRHAFHGDGHESDQGIPRVRDARQCHRPGGGCHHRCRFRQDRLVLRGRYRHAAAGRARGRRQFQRPRGDPEGRRGRCPGRAAGLRQVHPEHLRFRHHRLRRDDGREGRQQPQACPGAGSPGRAAGTERRRNAAGRDPRPAQAAESLSRAAWP